MSAHPNVNNIANDDTGTFRRGDQSKFEDDRKFIAQSIANTGQVILPPEIIGSIFRRCVEGERIFIPICHDCSAVTIPWALGQVCSRWRGILMSDPTIWSSLTISYENVWDKEALTRKIQEIILPRSKLDLISFTSSNVEALDDAVYYTGAVPTLIMPNLARFQRLILSMARTELEPLITSSPGLMISLETLELEFTNADRFEFHRGSITAFEDAPNLRKVHFTARYFCEFRGQGPLTLPWGQLTDIDISLNLPYAAVIEFLPHCTQLVNCRLSVGCMDELHELASPNKFTLPRLQSITLYSAYIDTYACPSLLTLLILPALKDFTLRLYDEVSVQSIIFALIDRSGCQLGRFEIAGYFNDAIHDVDELLQMMPSLRRLVVPRDLILPTSTIRHMMTGELVPCLEAIHCQVASLPLMLELLQSRGSGKSPGAPDAYKGIRCSVLWGHGKPECKCEA